VNIDSRTDQFGTYSESFRHWRYTGHIPWFHIV